MPEELPQLYQKLKFDYEPTFIRIATDAIKGVSTTFETARASRPSAHPDPCPHHPAPTVAPRR